ncbi:MAG: amidohydrolase, partial [Acidobacteriota bacterium]
ARPWAEAMAIRDEILAAVGTSADIDRLIGAETAVIELDGRLVLPGFNDSHIHFLYGAQRLDQVQLDEARSLQEMQDIVQVYARAHPERPWILGMGWIYAYVDGGRLPTRHDLDSVVSHRPVFLLAYDGHTAWVNTRALEEAGITRDSRAEGYGEVVKEPSTGEPTGVLKERGAMSLVSRVIPRPSRQKQLETLRQGIAYAHRFGITSVQNAHGVLPSDSNGGIGQDPFDLYEELEQAGELKIRFYNAITITRDTTDAELDRVAELMTRWRGPWLKAGAVKIVMDGVIESHTAAMLEPYADDPSLSGSPDYSQEEIDELIAKLDRREFQIFTHAIGDRAVRMVLDAYEKAMRANPGRRRRHRIEHIEVVSKEDIPRFASLGIIASMQPYHASPDVVDLWARNVGPERLDRAFAWKSIRSAGGAMIHGSDWPVVTLDPLVGLHAAVTRQDLDGKPEQGWIPAQRLSLEEAVYAYTLGGAWASFEENIKGSLERGKVADLVVLSEDIFKVVPHKIAETEVLMTVVGGEIVYLSPAFLSEEERRQLPIHSERSP